MRTNKRSALAPLLLLLGCHGGTSVLLTVELDPAAPVRQLELSGSAGELAFGPELRPAEEGEPLPSPQTTRVFLRDAYAGRDLDVTVRALNGGLLVGEVSQSVAVVKGKEVTLTLSLVGLLASNDAGVDAGVCAQCDPKRSDQCFNDTCLCGDAGVCSAGQACKNGECECGPDSCQGCCDGTTCLAGNTTQNCGNAGTACKACIGANCTDAGTCDSCNVSICPNGCCNGPNCVDPPSLAQCGAMGGGCTRCDAVNSNLCTNGGCKCGTGNPCAAGRHCTAGNTCVCDAVSCPKGCCDDNNNCQPGTAKSACGKNGAACDSCGLLLGACVNQACQ
ncbi:MAG: hypothetical protein ACT4TC_02970 [Myxococcaceae bacterium]